MKISPGWLKQNKFFKLKNASQKILTNFFVSEVFIKNVIFSMVLMINKCNSRFTWGSSGSF
jgi:hypothetical protein